MKKTYIAKESRLPAKKRSKKLQNTATTASTTPTTMSVRGDTIWRKETDEATQEVSAKADLPAKVMRRLTLVSDDGEAVTLSVSQGRLHVDKSVVSSADMVAYGTEESEVTTVEDLIRQVIESMRDAGDISSGAGIMSVALDYDSALYKFRVHIIDGNNNDYYSEYVDLPIETVVVSGSYDATNKALILTLKDGEKLTIGVSQLVAGLASETYVNNKISTEVTNRTSAINSAISTEVTNRNNAINSAIATEVTNRDKAISSAISTEVTNRNKAIATETANRTSAINSAIAKEVSDRNSAIGSAIGGAMSSEVTNRNNAISSAISGEAASRDKAISSAIATEVTNRNNAISGAISTEVTNRNTAITNAVNALDVASVGGGDRVLTTISETNGKIAATQRRARVKSGFIRTDSTTWRYMKIATLIHADPNRLPILIHGKGGWNNINDGWFGVLTISCNYHMTWGATLRIMRGTDDSVNIKLYIIYDSGSQGNATLWIDLRGNQYNSYTYSVIAHEERIDYISLHSHSNNNNGATSTSPLTEDKTWLEVPIHEAAYKEDNVASATKLQTPRALWGQSFDGTAGVNGDMEFAPGTNGRVLRVLNNGSFRLQAPTTGDWVCGFLGRNAANTQNLAGFGVFGTANTINYYYMGIGHGAPCLKVTPAGDMTINGSMVAKGDVTAYSDARVKSDVEELSPRGVLRPVSYIKDGRRGIGFIAQEVREVYPELVREDEDGMLSLNYNGLVAVLYAEVQELRQALREIKG